MKKINLILFVIVLLGTVSVGSYLYFIDGVSKTKQLEKEIASLQKIKQDIQKPVVTKLNASQLHEKRAEYENILQKLELEGSVSVADTTLVISGTIKDTYSYLMLKRVLHSIKNDTVTLQSSCMGRQCNESRYGFLIKFEPFALRYR
ncbi:MAG: hypothetical protein ACQESH_07190 [Campylobacterota bacterium]